VIELMVVILFSHLLLQLVAVKVVLLDTQLLVVVAVLVVVVLVIQLPQAEAQERLAKVTMVVLVLTHP